MVKVAKEVVKKIKPKKEKVPTKPAKATKATKVAKAEKPAKATTPVAKVAKEKVSAERPHYLQIYPWSKWLTRKSPLTLEKDHYQATQKSMGVMLRQNAKKLGVKIKIKNGENGTIVVTPILA